MWIAPLVLHASAPAHACGGFLCNASAPVLQAAERIVFAIDRDEGDVEMHVQITYTGPSEEFAWIVPVPGEPEIGIGTSALFTQLAFATQPTFALTRDDEGNCREPLVIGCSGDSAPVSITNSVPNLGVDVLAEEAVGPYLTVTLQADSSSELLAWLEENHYDIPSSLEPALEPYIVADAVFVALRLRKGADAGDLAPLVLTLDAEDATVPIQLTSIGATPDMRLEVYVLSDGRAVPTSYLHAQINDAAIDWWTFGSNYGDVLSQAADEAGGHAFVTESYGSTRPFAGLLFDAGAFDAAVARQASDSVAWLEVLRPMLLTSSTELFEVIEDHVATVGEGNGFRAWGCPTCFPADPAFDAGAATDDLVLRVADPMRHAQDLINAHDKLTRMTSTLDADEMTVDPVFVINDDLADTSVSSAHTANIVYECHGKYSKNAPRRLELPDGRTIRLPSEDFLAEDGRSEFELLSDLAETKARVIEQMDEHGEPVVIFDDSARQQELADAHNTWVESVLGCGCDGGPGTGVGLLGGVLSLVVARRRRASSRG